MSPEEFVPDDTLWFWWPVTVAVPRTHLIAAAIGAALVGGLVWAESRVASGP